MSTRWRHDVISRRKVLTSGECICSVLRAPVAAASAG